MYGELEKAGWEEAIAYLKALTMKNWLRFKKGR
jgi:hypothetical protein